MAEIKSQLLMIRENLPTLPELALPKGLTIRSFQDGDEEAWDRIITDSFEGKYRFTEMMLTDESYCPKRVLFVCEGQTPVATASAWYRPKWTPDTGYLHMVGVHPSYMGKRLGYLVSLAALKQMVQEGRTRAVLHTDDFRIPAIKTYLRLGFNPIIIDMSHQIRWKNIADKLPNQIMSPVDP